MNKAEQFYANSQSKAFRKLNPHLNPLAAGLSTKESKSNDGIKSEDKSVERKQESVEFCITIICFRKRLLDSHDNLASSCKPLVDRITEWLGFNSDDNKLLSWNYAQIKTRGKVGVIVKIDENSHLHD
jgi:hypothetical protein